jgi:hypothetical protein
MNPQFIDEGYDALFELCGPKANQIYKALRSWDADPEAAARELAAQAGANPKLSAALSALVEHFDATSAFTLHLALALTAQQGGDAHHIAGQIKAALVNIGGVTNIGSLTLQITQAPVPLRMPRPPEPARPPELHEFVGREGELTYYAEKLHTPHQAIITGMAGVGKTALAATLAVFRQGQIARELASAAIANLEVDPERSILLALEAVETTNAVDGTVQRAAEEALHRAVQASRVQLSVPSGGAAAFSPGDGAWPASGGDGDVHVWDTITGEEHLTLTGHTDSVFNAVFSSDGARLATNSLDGTTKVWDLATGRELLTLSGHSGNFPLGVAISPDSTAIATSSPDDGSVLLWDMERGAEVGRLPHTGPHGVNFSPDGGRLATGSFDGTAKVWDAATGQELLTLTGHTAGLRGVAFSPDCASPPQGSAERCGTRLATAAEDSTVRVYALDISDLIDIAQSRVTRSMTDDECRQYLHVDQCSPEP